MFIDSVSKAKERGHLRQKFRDHRFIQNCSSISLLNVDPKTISKSLSKKLADFPESLPPTNGIC